MGSGKKHGAELKITPLGGKNSEANYFKVGLANLRHNCEIDAVWRQSKVSTLDPSSIVDNQMAKILILEDNVDLGNIWSQVLETKGHQVSTVHTVEDFQNDRSGAELFIIDLNIGGTSQDPKFKGLVALSDTRFLTALRRDRIPTIVVSGHFSSDDASDELRDRLIPFQPDRILAKPVDIHKLLGTVQELLDGN